MSLVLRVQSAIQDIVLITCATRMVAVRRASATRLVIIRAEPTVIVIMTRQRARGVAGHGTAQALEGTPVAVTG